MKKATKRKISTIKFSDNIKCMANKIHCAKCIENELLTEYKKFMNIQNMPNITIEFHSLKEMGKTFGYIDYNKSTIDNFIIVLCYDYIEKHPKRMLPRIYHEFTHVLDDYTLLSEYKLSEKTGLLKIYSEFHATIVELMTATSFSDISSQKILSVEDNIMSPLGIKSLRDYYKAELDCWKQRQGIYPPPLNSKQFTELKMYAFYYFGKGYFFNKYIKENNEILYDLSLVSSILGDEIDMMFALLLTKTPDDELFQTLRALDIKMSKRHMELYQNKTHL